MEDRQRLDDAALWWVRCVEETPPKRDGSARQALRYASFLRIDGGIRIAFEGHEASPAACFDRGSRPAHSADGPCRHRRHPAWARTPGRGGVRADPRDPPGAQRGSRTRLVAARPCGATAALPGL